MPVELWAAIAAVLGTGANSGWGLRLESKYAASEERVDGLVKLTDTRHDDMCKRLDRIENGVDEVKRILMDR